MHVRTLLIALGLGAASLLPAFAADNSQTNSNVRRATRKATKYKAPKYKAPRKSKKPARATYGAH